MVLFLTDYDNCAIAISFFSPQHTHTELDGPNLPIKLMVKSACQCVKEFIDTITENIIGPLKMRKFFGALKIYFFINVENARLDFSLLLSVKVIFAIEFKSEKEL